jgi:hypothetical protein
LIRVKDLKVELEKCTGVPVQSQILMTSFGTQVKESNLKEILEAKDQVSSSSFLPAHNSQVFRMNIFYFAMTGNILMLFQKKYQIY